METLIPSVYFLRVEEKFSGDFIHLDKAVRQGPTLLYLQLFRRGYRTGVCRISQGMLAALCKCSVRALQGYIRKLEALNYIQVEPQPDGCHAYRLLLNDRVRLFSDSAFSFEQDAEFSPDQAQNLHMGGANSAPIKRVKELKALTPLSPLPLQRQRLRVNASTHGAFPGTSGDRPLPETSGRGGSFSPGKGRNAFLAANVAFERFLAAYPRKEAREAARGIWHQLWRRGELPSLDRLLAVLDQFRRSFSWTKEHGRFVPYAVNWLRSRRWLDLAESEPQAAPAPSPSARSRTLPEALPDPALEAVRPRFEQFFSRFAVQEKRGPAWGLWSSLFRKGNAPSAEDVKGLDMMDAFAFLQEWQRGNYATA